ncbi:hypothetical protein [Cyclobacterium jeungdonense]|uniref:NHL repeat containing protein n=1 Tax=Cyclobacterium jeungdonense TaxID=708087 RepID=A0ABT8CDQ9_9BACT|nr:hypothetical protein [Cyclobacterium jeungdonense]MDN3690665.1 hypothetical protein [Cyclobacterium jeungdonense]
MPSNLNKVAILIFILIVGVSIRGHLQGIPKKAWQLELHRPDKLSVDRRGNIFVSDQNGYLRQFSEQGDSLNIYAPAFSSVLTQLDAFWTVTIFLYSASLQQFEILDRFLNPISRNSIPDLGITGYISQASQGNNHGLWLYDEADLSLKKIDRSSGNTIQRQPLMALLPQSSLQVIQILERKNLLFLQIASEGMHLFDNQANYIKKIDIPGNLPAFIDNENIYSLENNYLIKTNFLSEVSSKLLLPDLPEIRALALTNNKVVLMDANTLMVFNRPESF